MAFVSFCSEDDLHTSHLVPGGDDWAGSVLGSDSHSELRPVLDDWASGESAPLLVRILGVEEEEAAGQCCDGVEQVVSSE